MSTPSQDPNREPGAVRVDPADGAQAAAAQTELHTQEARVEAQARGEEIHAEVARTDARRAEEETAKAADAVEQAERERAEAEARQKEAQERAERAWEDAEQAREQAEATGATGGLRGLAARRGFADTATGEPIVFGPFTAERPELLVGAAVAGGFILAKIIRKIAS